MRYPSAIAILCALGSCSDAQPPPAAEREVADDHDGALRLWNVDLSPGAVESLSPTALWQIGVDHLDWPAGVPADLTSSEIHQRLLRAKYRDVGDYGTGYVD